MRITNNYKLTRFGKKIFIQRENHQEKYYYILVEQDSWKEFRVMYVGKWDIKPGMELNIEPTHEFINSFDNIFEAFAYIESLNGDSDLH